MHSMTNIASERKKDKLEIVNLNDLDEGIKYIGYLNE